MNIYVGNLPFSIEGRELRILFEKFGEVQQVNIPQDLSFPKNRGYGFVVMSNDEEGMKAIITLDGSIYEGRALKVSVARTSRHENDPHRRV